MSHPVAGLFSPLRPFTPVGTPSITAARRSSQDRLWSITIMGAIGAIVAPVPGARVAKARSRKLALPRVVGDLPRRLQPFSRPRLLTSSPRSGPSLLPMWPIARREPPLQVRRTISLRRPGAPTRRTWPQATAPITPGSRRFCRAGGRAARLPEWLHKRKKIYGEGNCSQLPGLGSSTGLRCRSPYERRLERIESVWRKVVPGTVEQVEDSALDGRSSYVPQVPTIEATT